MRIDLRFQEIKFGGEFFVLHAFFLASNSNHSTRNRSMPTNMTINSVTEDTLIKNLDVYKYLNSSRRAKPSSRNLSKLYTGKQQYNKGHKKFNKIGLRVVCF
jgi:hypothetical protein